jgi:hypothetical protein
MICLALSLGNFFMGLVGALSLFAVGHITCSNWSHRAQNEHQRTRQRERIDFLGKRMIPAGDRVTHGDRPDAPIPRRGPVTGLTFF